MFKVIFFQPECYECKTIKNALQADHVRCLEYLLKRQNEPKLCEVSAKYGAIKCLKFAHEHGYQWDEDICYSAASSGYLDCLEFAHENGCPWDAFICSIAAYFGHLECLRKRMSMGF